MMKFQTATYLFESLSLLEAHLSWATESERQIVEVSWNTAALELPLNAVITFSYDLQGGLTQPVVPLNPSVSGTLEIRRDRNARVIRHQTSLAECPALIAELFSLESQQLVPRMVWRRKTMQWRVKVDGVEGRAEQAERLEAWLHVDAEVDYYDAATGLHLATEGEVRARALEGPQRLTLQGLIGAIPHLPAVSLYWMAEYHYKRLMRLPTVQDLPGYEYEIIERYQTESVRWYVRKVELEGIGRIKKGRIGFRGPRASLVRKGAKEMLEGGILKRSEEKSQGLNTWALSSVAGQASEMRRIKRQLYIRARESSRVYALCLDYCYVEGVTSTPLLQVELEYNGQLLLPPSEWHLTLSCQLMLAERFSTTAPKAALRALERAEWLIKRDGADEAQHALYTKCQSKIAAQLETEDADHEAVSCDSIQLEGEVLAEMRSLLKGLGDVYGFKESSQTKRAWLRKTLKGLDREARL
ncbi:MAG: hypothetical protein VYD19_00660 [Myxococcota bacterium]|nr:hypothetical protein [Myxococcota bacterium]